MDVVFNELHRKVRDYLGQVDDVVQQGCDRDALVVARDEMPRITQALKALFAGHQPDENGHCERCTTGRWWHRRTAPCRVFLDAQIALFQSDTSHGRHALTRR
jgi:hypothetical protein